MRTSWSSGKLHVIFFFSDPPLNAEPPQNGSNCWIRSRDTSQNVPPPSRDKQEEENIVQWLAQLPLHERLSFGLLQIAMCFEDASVWQLESRQTHGTCISANIMDDDILFCAPLALDDPANVWCLPPAPHDVVGQQGLNAP